MNSVIKVGWGYASKCNMHCKFCYSRNNGNNRKDIKEFTYNLAKSIVDENINLIKDINWGTGENVLVPDFKDIIMHVHDAGIPQSLTSNGSLYFSKHRDTYIQCIQEFDISCDFPDERHDKIRGYPGAFNLAVKLIDHLGELRKKVSIVTTLTRENTSIDIFKDLLTLAREKKCLFRINIMFPNEHNINLFPSKNAVYNVLNYIFKNSKVVSISDPLIAGLLCLHSSKNNVVRILPNGWVTPAAYLVEKKYWLKNTFESPSLESICKSPKYDEIIGEFIPKECSSCPYVDICKGGCIERRLFFYGTKNTKDNLCPLNSEFKANPFEKLFGKIKKENESTIHTNYLPTIIIKP